MQSGPVTLLFGKFYKFTPHGTVVSDKSPIIRVAWHVKPYTHTLTPTNVIGVTVFGSYWRWNSI